MPFGRGFCGCETWHGEKFELVPLTVLKLSLLIYQDMFMPWFYILVSINKHCDTWLVSECLPVEKLWLMTCSFKKNETSVGVALGCNHPEIIFTLLVWMCRWILNKVTDKMRHYRCVVTGEWWNSAEEMVGVCLVVQCMLYQWVCAFDLVNALSFPPGHMHVS